MRFPILALLIMTAAAAVVIRVYDVFGRDAIRGAMIVGLGIYPLVLLTVTLWIDGPRGLLGRHPVWLLLGMALQLIAAIAIISLLWASIFF